MSAKTCAVKYMFFLQIEVVLPTLQYLCKKSYKICTPINFHKVIFMIKLHHNFFLASIMSSLESKSCWYCVKATVFFSTNFSVELIQKSGLLWLCDFLSYRWFVLFSNMSNNTFFSLAVFPFSDPALGYSRPGALQKEHGTALLQECTCCCVCIWYDKHCQFSQSAIMDRGMQTTPSCQWYTADSCWK